VVVSELFSGAGIPNVKSPAGVLFWLKNLICRAFADDSGYSAIHFSIRILISRQSACFSYRRTQ
jgi:hypothetical protein